MATPISPLHEACGFQIVPPLHGNPPTPATAADDSRDSNNDSVTVRRLRQAMRPGYIFSGASEAAAVQQCLACHWEARTLIGTQVSTKPSIGDRNRPTVAATRIRTWSPYPDGYGYGYDQTDT